ncbi:MobH family relaxase [Herbaspirillum autotrophicum]|uniref:MobH family relaxase n=1 Tax=Herbaspirillum autotrophicum TaxID=180195 RepID=UPI00067B4129|nr:MobH family relaxase [Herbaspirillum autotrophicum]
MIVMPFEAWIWIASIVAAAGTAIVMLHHRLAPRPMSSIKDAPAPASAASLPAGQFAVSDYAALLKQTGTLSLVGEIQQKCGFADANFDRDVLPLLQRLAEFVQLLPASESHHHAQPGGLLIHLLEAGRNALHFRDALRLPPGATPEQQAYLGPRWTYGVLLAALLHDVGKPVADVCVTLFTKEGIAGRRWNGLAGTMPEAGGVSYTVEFPEHREYGLHPKLPLLLFNNMVPAATLRWLAEDAELLQLLLSCLSGDGKDHVLAALVLRADRESVRRNLLHGPRTRFASARTIPLIERLMQALRRMLAEGGQLPLNRPGAAGFIVAGEAWFVAGTLADRVRAWMDQSEVRHAGAAALPQDNARLFDIWQDYGAVIAHPDGGCIWRIAIEIGAWREILTMLRFPLAKLYCNPADYPRHCDGTLRVVEVHQAVAASENALPVASTEAVVTREGAQQEPDTSRTAGVSDLTWLDPDEAAEAALTPVGTSMSPPSRLQAPMAIVGKSLPSVAPDLAERFMAWIQGGLADGSIRFNESSAMVHFVEEGMLLVSPKIVQVFVDRFGADGDGRSAAADQPRPWARLQREFQRSGLPLRNPEAKGSYLFAYATTNSKSDRPVNCYLIPHPERFINPLPAPNPHFVSKAARLKQRA